MLVAAVAPPIGQDLHETQTPAAFGCLVAQMAAPPDGGQAARVPDSARWHITAEKALAKLRDEGLINSVIGKGYYVTGT